MAQQVAEIEGAITETQWRNTLLFRIKTRTVTVPAEGVNLVRKLDVSEFKDQHVTVTSDDNSATIVIDVEGEAELGDLAFVLNDDGSKEFLWNGGGVGHASSGGDVVPEQPLIPSVPVAPAEDHTYGFATRTDNQFTIADFTDFMDTPHWSIDMSGSPDDQYIGFVAEISQGNNLTDVRFSNLPTVNSDGAFNREGTITDGNHNYTLWVSEHALFASVYDGVDLTVQVE